MNELLSQSCALKERRKKLLLFSQETNTFSSSKKKKKIKIEPERPFTVVSQSLSASRPYKRQDILEIMRF